jgi:hypothetical protein
MRVPGSAVSLTLGEHRASYLNEHQDNAQNDGFRCRERNDDLRHPPDLGDRDGCSIGQAHAAPRGVPFGCPEPLEHQSNAHDHIAKYHH